MCSPLCGLLAYAYAATPICAFCANTAPLLRYCCAIRAIMSSGYVLAALRLARIRLRQQHIAQKTTLQSHLILSPNRIDTRQGQSRRISDDAIGEILVDHQPSNGEFL